MKDPMIVASAKDRGAMSEDSTQAWLVLGWIGLAFLVVGGVDFALTWFPLNLGNREWEFATVTQSFNGLPILVLGVGLLTVAADQTGRRWWGHLGLVASLLLLVWVMVGFVLWALSVSLALETVPESLALGIKKAVTRTLIQACAYAALLTYVLGRSWRIAKTGAVTPRNE